MNVIRSWKFALKVKSKRAWSLLLRLSKIATMAYNYGALMIGDKDALRQDFKEMYFKEWKNKHPDEAEKYNIQEAKYLEYLEKRKAAKENNTEYPVEVERPKMPKAAVAEVNALLREQKTLKTPDYETLRDTWYVSRLHTSVRLKDETLTATDGDLLSQTTALKAATTSASGTLRRRKEGFSASMPKAKPEYADTPVSFFKPHYSIRSSVHKVKKNNIEVDKTRWTVDLKVKGEKELLSLRFFPTGKNIEKTFDPAMVKSCTVGKERGTSDWFVVFGGRVPESREILPSRTLGVDLNSGSTNSVVVADKDGEIFRRVLPQTLEEIEKEIVRLKQKKNALLNINGNNHKSKQAVRLRSMIRCLYGRQKHIRENALHHISKEIVASGSTVALEDLDLQKMTKSAKGTVGDPGHNVRGKAEMNRKMLSVSCGRLRQMVEYKSSRMANSKVVIVNPAYSSQKCCFCGQIGERSGRSFKCLNSGCGHYMVERDSDENAAMGHARAAGRGEGKTVEKTYDETKIARAQRKRAEKFAALRAGNIQTDAVQGTVEQKLAESAAI